MARANKEIEQEQDEIRRKILHLLRIYPVISPTMLQSGLGPYLKPAIWRPVLQTLIERGEVEENSETLPTIFEKFNSYTKLSLPGVEVILPDEGEAA